MDGGCEYLGAVRIKDGLFLGDALSAWDVDFLTSNGVEAVVNCTTSEFEYNIEGLRVLQLPWPEDQDVWLLNAPPRAGGELLNVEVLEMVKFVNEADALGASCLIHSRRGRSRAVLAVCLYLMLRFYWTAQKALEFVLSRRPDLQLRRQFIIQLLQLEKLLRSSYSLSSDWDVPPRGEHGLSPEEVLLRNTFKNSLQLLPDSTRGGPAPKRATHSVTWRPGDIDRILPATPLPHSDSDADDNTDDLHIEVDDESLSLEIASPDHVITPRERSDANMHWSVPARTTGSHDLSLGDLLDTKKSSQDLTVEIPLTVHPALRAARSLPANSPARIPRTARVVTPPVWRPVPLTGAKTRVPSIWPSISQMRTTLPSAPGTARPATPFILPSAQSPLRNAFARPAGKSFSLSRISAPVSAPPPPVARPQLFGGERPATVVAVMRRFTDAGTWNPHYAPAVIRT